MLVSCCPALDLARSNNQSRTSHGRAVSAGKQRISENDSAAPELNNLDCLTASTFTRNVSSVVLAAPGLWQLRSASHKSAVMPGSTVPSSRMLRSMNHITSYPSTALLSNCGAYQYCERVTGEAAGDSALSKNSVALSAAPLALTAVATRPCTDAYTCSKDMSQSLQA